MTLIDLIKKYYTSTFIENRFLDVEELKKFNIFKRLSPKSQNVLLEMANSKSFKNIKDASNGLI